MQFPRVQSALPLRLGATVFSTPKRYHLHDSKEGFRMTNTITAANKALLRRFYKEVYVDWDMALVDAVVSPHFTSHDWAEGGGTGPQAFRKYYAAIRSAVPDARYEVDDLIAEADRVVVRWTMRGTHEGYFGDIAPTGRPIALDGIAIYRVENGTLMERWVVSDLHGLLIEIGASASC
jgi:predicted ester cyclase